MTGKACIYFHASAHESGGSQKETLQVKGKVDEECCKIFLPRCFQGTGGKCVRLFSSLNHSPGCLKSSHPVLPGKMKKNLFWCCRRRREKQKNKKTAGTEWDLCCWGDRELKLEVLSVCAPLGPLQFAVSLTFLRFMQVSTFFQNFQNAPAEHLQCWLWN